MPELKRPDIPNKTFNIKDYGAKEMSGDNPFKSTEAIHKAIEAAHAAGGGKVVIPAGEWLTGPIHLKSNLNLHIAKGATVYFSKDREDYLPVVPVRWEGVEVYNYSPLIYANNVKNVAVTGKGVLDGQGDPWWEWAYASDFTSRLEATKTPLSRRPFGKGAGEEGLRPNFVVFWKCEDILVEGITLKDSPMWNVHLIYSEKAIVRDVHIHSLRSPNGDGVVVDSTKHALVEYNHFETGDDAVVIKSGYNEDGLEVNIPTEKVVVRNYSAKDVRTGSGGIVFGSETSGGIKDVYVHSANFEGSDRGIRFKTERGRGNVTENIYIRDIKMKDLTYEAINFNTYYSGAGVTGPAPLIKNIQIKDIEIDGVPTAISLIGLPEKWLENVLLENITVKNAEAGARIERTKNLTFKNVEIQSQKQALIAKDVYEFTLDGVSLSDEAEGPPLRIEGSYTGALNLGSFKGDQVEFGDDVPQD